jgi:UDP-2,3-diacylglucosamine pyrophosphatase LpxH
MHQDISGIAEILINCEKNGTAPEYVVDMESYKEQKTSLFQQALPLRTEPFVYNSEGEEIFVVSDLHIASGRNHVGVYKGTENFFADDSFYRFLEFAQSNKKTSKALLIINGDIFDFLRITESPAKKRKVRLSRNIKQMLKLKGWQKAITPDEDKINKEYEEWRYELEKIGIKKTRHDLEASISKKEEKYGLKTDDYKTIYKLIKIKHGHPAFFKALSRWLEQGNRLLVLKGNHDLEIYWLAVRNYLRLIIAEGIVNKGLNKNIENVLKETVLPNITFIDDSIVIDKDFYVEHGHRYDKFCMVLENPELGNSGQINIPFGSFFNRYLLNRVELFYPYLDNVKPAGNVLPMLMRENFPLGLKVLVHHIPLLLRILTTNFRYVWFMLSKVFLFALALLLPATLIIYFNYSGIESLITNFSKIEENKGIGATALNQVKSLALIFLSYLLSRFVAWLQLTEPSSLDKFAKIRFEGTNYRIMTMGHTHNPGEYIFDNDKRFYNTGTWIPVIETSTADIREDKTYTFLHLIRDSSGKLQPDEGGLLQRWNDDAERAEPQVLVMRK